MSGLELKSSARKIIAENAPKVFFVSILYILFTTVLSELQWRLPGTSAAIDQFLERISAGEQAGLAMLYSNFRPPGAALTVVLRLMVPVLHAGYMSYCLKLNREIEGEYKDILDGFLFFIKILMISIITSILTILWSLLFLFPGIAAHYRYRQAYYILLDNPEKGIMQCIRESKRLMAGRKLDLFLVDLSFIGWIVTDAVVTWLLPLPFMFPVISIWLTPYMSITRAAYYNKLIKELVT